MSRLCGAAEEAADADGLKGALLKLLLATLEEVEIARTLPASDG